MSFRLQEIAWHHGKCVLAGEKREYGHAKVKIEKHKGESVHVDKLFNGLPSEIEVYMSHGETDFRGILLRVPDTSIIPRRQTIARA